jgi:hypothetical protein
MSRAPDRFAAEMIKVLSLRSTYALAAAGIGLSVASALFLSGRTHLSAYGKATYNPLVDEFNTGVWATLMLAAACAGAAGMTGEFHSGLIRTTTLAVPGRMRTVLAKAAAYTAVAGVVGVAAEAGNFGLSRMSLAGAGIRTTVSSGTLVSALLSSALALPVSALLGLAFGTVLRHPAVATAAVVVALVLVPSFLSHGGGFESVLSDAMPYHAWRTLVGQATDGPVPPGTRPPSMAVAWMWFLGWPCLAVPLAGLVLRRRDL